MNELYIGTGKLFAQTVIADRQARGHTVFEITGQPSSNPNATVVDWNKLNVADLHKIIRNLPEMDVVVFNQNATSLSRASFKQDNYKTLELWQQLVHWQQSHFISCQLPFAVMHSIRRAPVFRAVWVLSSMIVNHSHDYQYADYMSGKYENYMLMKNFAAQSNGFSFGIDPGQITEGIVSTEQLAQKVQKFGALIEQNPTELNGSVWELDNGLSIVTKTFGV